MNSAYNLRLKEVKTKEALLRNLPHPHKMPQMKINPPQGMYCGMRRLKNFRSRKKI
jgi:hypothetical protein